MSTNSIEKARKTDYTILNIPYVRREKAVIPWKHLRKFGEHTIFLVISGSCHATCNNNKYILKPGDILYVKKGYMYSSSELDLPFEYIMIEFEFDENISMSYELLEYYKPANPEKYHILFEEMYKTFNTVGTATALKLKRNMYDILINLAREVTHYKDNYNYQRIKYSIKHMNENVFEKYIDIKNLADISDLSLSQFNRIFKNVFSKTPTKYMNDLRIERGKKLLSETTLPVGTISDMCGFSSTYYFSKMIKSATGNSPLQYRAKYFE